MIVPAVTDVCLPQAAQSKEKRSSPCGQPLALAHAGHRNPEGQRAGLDLVAFQASGPAKPDRVARVFDFETGLQGAEGDFAALRGDRQCRRAAKIEISAIPEVGLDERQRPINRQFRLGAHACSSSFGYRARLQAAAACKGESPSDALAT